MDSTEATAAKTTGQTTDPLDKEAIERAQTVVDSMSSRCIIDEHVTLTLSNALMKAHQKASNKRAREEQGGNESALYMQSYHSEEGGDAYMLSEETEIFRRNAQLFVTKVISDLNDYRSALTAEGGSIADGGDTVRMPPQFQIRIMRM